MKHFLFLLTFTLVSNFGSAQLTTLYPQAVSFEGYGLARYGSINYHRLLRGDSSFQLYGRVGIGVMRFINFENKFNPDIAVPTVVEALIGEDKHYWEMSFGQVYTSYTAFIAREGRNQRFHEVNLAVGTAYRYMPNARLEYRIALYAILDNLTVQRPWGGLSISYNFGKR